MSVNQEQFRVSLDTFDGPLDLLLYLVRRAEVDIYDIPIAQIADEYLEVLKSSPTVDVEMAGEFLVMASALIELKSRSLVPPEQMKELDEQQSQEEVNEDPREDLIRQLLAFQRIRTASELLEDKRLSMMRRFYVKAGLLFAEEDQEPSLELEDVHILDLADAYEHIASAIDFERIGEHHVAFEDIPIEMCQEDLLERLRLSGGQSFTLQNAIQGLTLPERVGIFLAALELVRLSRIKVHQESTHGDIVITLVEGSSLEDEETFLEH